MHIQIEQTKLRVMILMLLSYDFNRSEDHLVQMMTEFSILTTDKITKSCDFTESSE